MSGVASLFSSYAGIVAVVAAVLALLALGLGAYAMAHQLRWSRRYQHLLKGTTGENLEAVLHDHVSRVRETAARVETVERLAQQLQAASVFNLQHLGVIRFNPFHDTGSDQSFAVALVDGNGNGLVLSSLHARDVTRVYAKPLREWDSSYTLTDEEKEAIALAEKKE